MANLDQIANFIADNFDSMTTTVLYDSSKHTSGTIQIPTIGDYDALVVYTMTNTEYFADIIFLGSNLGVGQNITYTSVDIYIMDNLDTCFKRLICFSTIYKPKLDIRR